MCFQVAVIVPTCNAGAQFPSFLEALASQSQKFSVVIIDSSSTDETALLAEKFQGELINIARDSFNHGGTRQMAVDSIKEVDLVVFLTQDALLADVNAIEQILKPFHDNHIAAVCGRQLPAKEATAIEAHARLYNYSSNIYNLHSRSQYFFRSQIFQHS